MDAHASSAPLKVGLMVPANNTTMEKELTAWLPDGSRCVTLRIPRGAGLLTRETLPPYKASALELAATFPGDIDVVAYGCTAAGFIAGPQGEAQLAGELAAITGKPVVTTARSMVAALQAAGARHIALVTPYSDEVNRNLGLFLAEGGIEARRVSSLAAADVEALGRITASEVAALARSTVDDSCDALFIACSQLPTYEILDSLQAELGRPAWSSIKATAWRALQAVAQAARR
ncbi:aspartate/glutamate racemase family protein [Pigmentiphaga sp. YJ18]|uniref:maleate cis-trans isomerase family protein n=1 Tax=Pigmentiphaga sp. YJ18 TaxID=3134907 RepID=UPI003115B8B9